METRDRGRGLTKHPERRGKGAAEKFLSCLTPELNLLRRRRRDSEILSVSFVILPDNTLGDNGRSICDIAPSRFETS